MIPDPPENTAPAPAKPRSGRAVGCVGCLAAFILSFLALILLLAIMSRDGSLPAPFQALRESYQCGQNMEDLIGAINRFQIQQGRYPERLEDVYPEYLKSAGSLRCPLADDTKKENRQNGKVETSYEYLKPGPGTKPDDVVIRCDRHSFDDQGTTYLIARKDGKITAQRVQSKPPQKQDKKSDEGG